MDARCIKSLISIPPDVLSHCTSFTRKPHTAFSLLLTCRTLYSTLTLPSYPFFPHTRFTLNSEVFREMVSEFGEEGVAFSYVRILEVKLCFCFCRDIVLSRSSPTGADESPVKSECGRIFREIVETFPIARLKVRFERVDCEYARNLERISDRTNFDEFWKGISMWSGGEEFRKRTDSLVLAPWDGGLDPVRNCHCRLDVLSGLRRSWSSVTDVTMTCSVLEDSPCHSCRIDKNCDQIRDIIGENSRINCLRMVISTPDEVEAILSFGPNLRRLCFENRCGADWYLFQWNPSPNRSTLLRELRISPRFGLDETGFVAILDAFPSLTILQCSFFDVVTLRRRSKPHSALKKLKLIGCDLSARIPLSSFIRVFPNLMNYHGEFGELGDGENEQPIIPRATQKNLVRLDLSFWDSTFADILFRCFPSLTHLTTAYAYVLKMHPPQSKRCVINKDHVAATFSDLAEQHPSLKTLMIETEFSSEFPAGTSLPYLRELDLDGTRLAWDSFVKLINSLDSLSQLCLGFEAVVCSLNSSVEEFRTMPLMKRLLLSKSGADNAICSLYEACVNLKQLTFSNETTFRTISALSVHPRLRFLIGEESILNVELDRLLAVVPNLRSLNFASIESPQSVFSDGSDGVISDRLQWITSKGLISTDLFSLVLKRFPSLRSVSLEGVIVDSLSPFLSFPPSRFLRSLSIPTIQLDADQNPTIEDYAGLLDKFPCLRTLYVPIKEDMRRRIRSAVDETFRHVSIWSSEEEDSEDAIEDD